MRLNEPMRMGDTFVMEAGRRGQELGHIQLELGASGLDETPFKDDSRRHTAYWSIQQQLGVLKQLLSTVDPGQEPPAQAVEVNRLVTEQIKKYKEMSPDGGSNTLSASMIPLDDSVQDHPAVAALVNGKKGAAAPSAAAAVHPTKTGPIVGTPMRIPQEVVDEVDRQAAQQRR